MPEPTLQEQIDAVVARYQPEIDRLEAEGKQMEDDVEKPSTAGAIIGVDFKVDWKDTTLAFDLPKVTMKRQDFSFDTPSVRMKQKKVVFHTPSIRMVTKVVGKYPCFKKLKWHSCKIKTKVPETFMERQEISTDIPELFMERQEIGFDIPEFRMERVEWKLKLPRFTVINVSAEVQQMEDRGDAMKARGETLAAAMKAEIDSLLIGGGAAGSQAYFEQRALIAKPFDEAIAAISRSIDEMVAKRIDPIKVPAEGGDINLRKMLAEVMAQRDAAIAQFDAQIEEPADLPLAA